MAKRGSRSVVPAARFVQLTVLLLCLGSVAAAAQVVRAVTVKPPDAVLAEEFTAVSSIRELENGRVLLTDRREQRALVVDFRTGQVSPFARRGHGPGEYGSPPQIFQLAGDSSLLVARTQRRWLLLHGGMVVSTLPPDAPAIVQTQASIIGTDSLGRVLTTKAPQARPGVTVVSTRDSLELVLVDRNSGTSDTVARLRRMASRSSLTLDAQGREKESSFDRPGVMSTEETAAIFPDGAVAIARLDPFRIDWRFANGSWIRGDSLPVRPVALDARQKQWYMRAIAGDAAPQPPETLSGWPATIPPFLSTISPLTAASDGRLLVRRSRDADHNGTRYLIVNRRGQLDGEISLAPNISIVGVGRRSLYTTATDSDGIQRLQRHPWPN